MFLFLARVQNLTASAFYMALYIHKVSTVTGLTEQIAMVRVVFVKEKLFWGTPLKRTIEWFRKLLM